MRELEQLLEIMVALRDPQNGCPWDKQQDFKSIAEYTVEEAYEVADAIERNDLHDLKDELGDLLFQVVFHAQMAQEVDAFGFRDVVMAINEKLLRRHPHVFGDDKTADEAQLNAQWQQHKREERSRKSAIGENIMSELDGIAATLPSLRWAEKIQKRAAATGFDWPDIAPVWKKLEEEIGELKDEVTVSNNTDRIEDELGDVLFSVVNLARHLKVKPEQALRRANKKFITRFQAVEACLREEGKPFSECDTEELETYWRSVK